MSDFYQKKKIITTIFLIYSCTSSSYQVKIRYFYKILRKWVA